MPQRGFLDFEDCLDGLDDQQDILIAINAAVPWDDFRPVSGQAWRKPRNERKPRAGRKPFDTMVMPGMSVLRSLRNPSCGKTEFFARGRRSGGFRALALRAARLMPGPHGIMRRCLRSRGRRRSYFTGSTNIRTGRAAVRREAGCWTPPS